jgi:peroxiredoxin Q/BCP
MENRKMIKCCLNPLTGFMLFFALALPLWAADQPSVGDSAPAFRLQDQNSEWHQLEDYRGKWLAIYFYPKDDTPGCTTEACNFRDNVYVFRRIGAEVLGISLDDVASHKEFADKYKLPFTLLADPNGETVEAYGTMRDLLVTRMARRESFLINPEGIIAKHYAKVDPDTHTDEVIADLERLIADNSGS